MKKFLNNQKGFTAFELVLIVLVLAATGAVGYFAYQSQQDNTDYSVNVPKKVPKATPDIKPTEVDEPETTSVYVISDLGVKFNLPSSIGDLTHKVVRLEGEQSVSTVAFSSKSLEKAGCSVESAPLGHLTYTEGKGGVLVAKARFSNMYYIEPKNSCGSNWQKLKSSLSSLVSTE